MKTYQDWNTASTLTSYLNPEDEIDQEMVNYFCEKLPPQTMTSTVIQIGEPYNHYMDKSRKWHPVFPTIKRIKDQWIYKGLCFLEILNRPDIISLLQKYLKTMISTINFSGIFVFRNSIICGTRIIGKD